ncbi:hypothetical protein BDV12DRAFT_171434 [Aspergillus spectabilis]
MQPLDSMPFQQIKKNHADAVNRHSIISRMEYDKVYFLADIEEIRTRIFTKAVIASGWRETGIAP